MAVGVRLAIFLQLVALPLGALAEQDERVVARVGPLVLEEQPDELVEIDLVLGYDASDRGGICRVERRKSGIAPKDTENADPLMRANGGALALNGVARPRDGGRKTDAVLGIVDVVVHRLRDRDDLDANRVELGRVTQSVVSADSDQMFDTEGREVRQHSAGDVPGFGYSAPFGAYGDWKVLAEEMAGQLLHLGRVGAAGF